MAYFNAGYTPPMYPIQQPYPMQPQQLPQPMQQPPMQQPQPYTPTMQYVPDEMTARRSQFTMDGKPTFYLNENHREIYMKSLNMENGSINFAVFRSDGGTPTEYATAEDLAKLRGEFDELKKALGGNEA